MRVTVSGYYGQLNYGDDLFCEAAFRGITRFWPDAVPKIVGPPFPGASSGLAFMVPEQRQQYWLTAQGPLGRAYRAYHRATAVRQSDLLLYGGGSTLMSLPRVDARRMQACLARFQPTRLAGIGLSVGPFPTGRDRLGVARLLNQFEYLSVRDTRSALTADSLGLSYQPVLAADLTGILLDHPDYGGMKPEREGILGVNLLPLHRMRSFPIEVEPLFSSIRALADSTGFAVRLFALSASPADRDQTSLELLREYLRPIPCELVSRLDFGPKEIWRALSACSALLTVRLHGAVTAYLTGVPFILYEYHEKCKDFADDIGQAKSLRWPFQSPTGPNLLAMVADPTPPGLDTLDFVRLSRLNFTQAPWADPSAAARQPD